MENKVKIKDLVYGYPKQDPIYQNLSLQLEEGSITGLLGKNGAGKTTLLKLITGLMRPKQGKITVNGISPAKRLPKLLEEIYFVPEEFFFPAVSMNDYIKAHRIFYPKFDSEAMYKMLAEFELSPDKKLTKISHGQKKKFIISFALATRCGLLVLDEPTNGLDIPSKALFRKILAGSLSEDQLVVISTHQVKDVENLIDTLVMVDNGEIAFKATVEELTNNYQFVSGTQVSDQAIYSEPIPGGFKSIVPRKESYSELDIELLFNAVASGVPIIKNTTDESVL